VAVIDRFTFSALEFLSKTLNDATVKSNLADFADSWDTGFLLSRPVLDTHRVQRLPKDIALTEFFGSRQTVFYPDQKALAPITNAKVERVTRPPWAQYNPRLLIDKRADIIRPAIKLTKIVL
jgi:glycosylphosphatidylinositol transamidase (GPIT) subunit GPI8